MGSANIFAVLYLIKKGYKGQITMIDKGKSIVNRQSKDILNGFMGAGAFSDGKYVFANYRDSTPLFISDNDRFKYQEFIKSIIEEHIKTVNKSPERIHDLYLKDIELKQSETWHLGTNNNLELGNKIHDFLIKNKVELIFNLDVTDIDYENKVINDYIHYDYCQIGLGRTGYKQIKKLVPDNSFDFDTIHIGGRFETHYNYNIKKIAEDIQYDFKFIKQYEKDISIRTFCVNHKYSYIIQEKHDFGVLYNGHAYNNKPIKQNDLTNFAILCQLHDKNVDKIQKYLLSLFKEHSIVINGKTDFISSFKRNINTNVILKNWKEFINIIENKKLLKVFNYIQDFIIELNEILHYENNYNFYIPEVKLTSGILKTENNCQLNMIKDVAWVGDSCLGTRGIVPSAISGIHAVSKI